MPPLARQAGPQVPSPKPDLPWPEVMVHQLIARCKAFFARDEGLSITEYGMLVAFIAFVLIVVVVLFGGGISTWFGTRAGSITTV